MCGIAGMVDWRAETGRRVALDRRSDVNDTLHHAVRTAAGLGRGRGRCGARSAAPRHHRSQSRRRAAHAFGRRALRHHLQRRDLQLPRHPRELEAAGRLLRSDSDTEVLLEACACGAWKRRSSARSACSPSHLGSRDAEPWCWRAIAWASSRCTTPRRRSGCCSPPSSRLFTPSPVEAEDRRRCGSGLSCVTPISHSRIRSIAKPPSSRPATF